MIGVIANAARHEPEAVAALRAGSDDKMNRLLRLPLPEPYSPTKVEALRDRLRTKPKQAAPAKTKAKATKQAKPARQPPKKRQTATGRRPAQIYASDGASRRSGHHGGGQLSASAREPVGQPARTGGKISARDGGKPSEGKRGKRALEGQRYG